MCTLSQKSHRIRSSFAFHKEKDQITFMRFPQKLWKIVEECDSGAIGWGISGKTIVIELTQFQAEYLNKKNSFFKTKNITSFIRQLNLYGFRKVTARNRDYLLRTSSHEYIHKAFERGRYDLLPQVQRKPNGRKIIKNNFSRFNGFALETGENDRIFSVIVNPNSRSKFFIQRLIYSITDDHVIHSHSMCVNGSLIQLKIKGVTAVNVYCKEMLQEMEDPLADVVNSNSTDAVSELFGFDFNAIPNAEDSMEWINKNSRSLDVGYSLLEEQSCEHQCLGTSLPETLLAKCLTSLPQFEDNIGSQRQGLRHL